MVYRPDGILASLLLQVLTNTSIDSLESDQLQEEPQFLQRTREPSSLLFSNTITLAKLQSQACALQPDGREKAQRELDRSVLAGAVDYAAARSGGKTSGGHDFSMETEVLTALSCMDVISNVARPSVDCSGSVAHRIEALCQSSAYVKATEQPLLQTGVSSVCSEWHGLDRGIWDPHHCLKAWDLENIHLILKSSTSNFDAGRDYFAGKRCAVVGNSGNLLSAGHGQDIDAHDVVIRFGCAPTRGFESDVGTKTSFRFAYPEALGADGGSHQAEACGGIVDFQAEGSTFMIRLYKYNEIDWWAKMLTNPSSAHRDGFWHEIPRSIPTGMKMSILNPKWIDAIHEGFGMNKAQMSQGMVGVALALEGGCSEVNIYGFGLRREDGSAVPNAEMHYYE